MLSRSPWETCSFLKKERGGVDLKERVNSGVGLRGVEGGETKVRMYWKQNNLGKERIKKKSSLCNYTIFIYLWMTWGTFPGSSFR